MKIAIIPARGGSKRIPRKNIKLFRGKPMIAWSIEAAQKAACFDRIIVSTDDEEIVEIAQQWGAEVPFIRPADLSDDYAVTSAVIAHAIEQLSLTGDTCEYVCCLYATAPFVQASDLKRGLEQLKQGNVDFVFSATSYAFPIQRALKLSETNHVSMYQPEHMLTRSQELEEAYHDAGQFYWGKAIAFSEQRPFFSVESIALLLPRHRVQDIDTPEDWQRAEALFRILEEEVG